MLAVMIIGSLLPGVALADSGAPQALNALQEQAIQKAVKESLKDPESASFKGLLGGQGSNGTQTACGFVNAKNSFGGYEGFAPFHGLLVTYTTEDGATKVYGFSVVTIAGAGISAQSVYDWCIRDGINL
ncbi:hypothetical protein BPNPMPFG_002481 [Mesorhizobium sp. AR07]|uniref:hypothetical protein n=1 Tax=Mesorhizobium sp. AR07 TaxID=2865838 RepID=UPI00215FCA7D|nr:hypothetical protein [Mesorhizobium sp. AR07]UVK46773.1 hypothetical protein BPNPMPFG_002481 [Mesorhizobium sp. AR07]